MLRWTVTDKSSALRPQDMPIENTEAAQRLLLLEIWSDIRPYVRCISKDFLICAVIWVSLWLLTKLEHFLSVPGWPSDLMPNVHGFSAIALVALFAGFLIDDVYQIRVGRRT